MTIVEYPANYGLIMKPLDRSLPPAWLKEAAEASALVREWLDVQEVVSRAEKISSWTEWTPEQTQAYEAGNYTQFSRLRGYTEEEIAQFERYIALTHAVTAALADDDFCISAEFEIQQLVWTEEMGRVDAHLVKLSKEASYAAKKQG